MKQQKDVFMTLLTGLGAALGIITYFLCTFLFHKYETIGALSIFGLAMIFRVIGYFFDKMLAKKWIHANLLFFCIYYLTSCFFYLFSISIR